MTGVDPAGSRLRRGETWALIALLAAQLAIGTTAVLGVPFGLPYDEPAHWSNVAFFAQHRSLPVLGDPGVLYEAQQTPLYYAASAVISGVVGEGPAALVAVRFFGLLGGVTTTALVFFVLRRVVPRDGVVVFTAAAFVGVNPMLIVMSTSVQNDSWALAAGCGAVLAALATQRWNGWAAGALIGGVASAAILVKMSMAPLVFAVVLWLLLRRRVAAAVACAGVLVLATGWWFVRNLTLYGDLTGQAGVQDAGFTFGEGGLGLDVLARSALTYLTIPTEYLRNSIVAPWWIDVAAVLIGVVIAVGAVMLTVRRGRALQSDALLLVTLVAVASLAAWLIQVTFGWQVAFRTAYGVIPLVALAYGGSTLLARARRPRLVLAGGVIALLVLLCVWTGLAIAFASAPRMLEP